eukprot:CAMPEP_0116081086 /NCGR_PEP_ID=MMETSP0327-20121206/2016_1 /TAXON_ID=44447 /ORGANISM="Pseudo-nitzschia delicatissima, Strain B596" /LENGTH=1905 /DNA_ID=CAMNT_0003571811 /DNA_START=23 /DNA_END=5740 /DNA_ORIENTATION=+
MTITEESFLASLKRIDRRYGAASRKSANGRRPRQPPDEASYTVGKSLAKSLLGLSSSTTTISKQVQEETFTFLADRETNPAVCQGFFDALSKHDGLDLEDLIASCILFTEQNELQEENNYDGDDDDDCGAVFGPLTCMIRAYAHRVRFRCELESFQTDASTTETIARTYSKLETQAGRLAMLREFTDVAFAIPKQQQHDSSPSDARLYSRILNPLLACSVISPNSSGGDSSSIESLLCMEGIWRHVDILIEDASTGEAEEYAQLHLVLDVVTWLTGMLDLYLLSIASQKKRQQKITGKELAHRWLVFVLDVGLFVAQSFEDDNHKQQRQKVMEWFEGILSRTLLRWFSIVPSYRVHMGSFWKALRKLMEIYASQNTLSLESALKMSTMALCHPIKEDVREALGAMAMAAEQTQRLHPIAISMMKGLGSISSRDPVCAANANHLLQVLVRTKPLRNKVVSSKKLEPIRNMIQFFEDIDSIDTIMSYLASEENDLFDDNHTLSAIQQSGSLLLFGIGLLENCDLNQRKGIYVFLDKLLLPYPHLGISLLPVVIDSINTCVVRGDGDRMMEQIEFLAEVLVRDPQCAREIWNLLGKEFMRDKVPVSIRASIVRLFPKICQANKRLYKRIIEAMGNALVSGNEKGDNAENDFELRLAVAATTADLARENFVRDPTDVISWLQDFITDTGWVRPISTLHRFEAEHTKEAIAHYSILTLNSLVVAGELDFKLVLVVFGKKLCDIHNVKEVSRLPPLVLESVIMLLGAGEWEEDDDSSDEDDDRLKSVGISPQVSRSVETLINLWSHECLRPEHFTDPTTKAIIFRCKSNIMTSLANYSFEALGVDDEGIQSACSAASIEAVDKPRALVESGVRYNALKSIICDGIEISNMINERDAQTKNQFRADLNDGVSREFSNSLTAFISKILELEEETLASSLWQKRQSSGSRRRNTKTPKSEDGQRPNLSKQLPSPKSVKDTYVDNRDQATSIGALMSFEGDPTQLLDDLITDATRNFSDDLVQIIYVQSFLNAARSVLRAIVASGSITESLEKLLDRMQDRYLDNPDSTSMFSASIGALIPTILGPHGDYSSYIKDISNDVWEAYNDRSFEFSDVAKLCLGLLGLCNLSLGNSKRAVEIVDCLEKMTAGYGGLPSCSAYYAVGIIAQKCAITGDAKTTNVEGSNDMIQLNVRIVTFLLNELTKCTKGAQEVIATLVNSMKNRTITPEDLDVLFALEKSSLKVKKSKLGTSRSVFIALGICLPSTVTNNKELVPALVCFLESFDWGSGVGFCLHPILLEWRQSTAIGSKEIERKYESYMKSFEEGAEQQAYGLHERLYAIMALSLKSNSYSIEKLRSIRNEESTKSALNVLSVSCIASMPCLGNGRYRLVTDSPSLLETSTHSDVTSTVQFVSDVSNDMVIMMRGFLASLITFNELDHNDDSRITVDPLIDEFDGVKLPEAHLGTVLEIIMSTLHDHMKEQNELGLVSMLHCLEVIALPNQFSILVETLAKEEDVVRSACIKLLISQIEGRPRAVFDGRDFVKLASKICKMPAASIGNILGEKEAAEIFVDSFGEMMTKFISQDVEQVIENVFHFCMFQFDRNSELTITLFESIKRILTQAETDKSPRFSPKCIKSLHIFLQQKVFPGIHDATSKYGAMVPPNQVTKIVEAYADCSALIPNTSVVDNKIIHTTDIAGFCGECLRIRLLMSLIQNDSHSWSSHSYREITSSIAWMSQQLIGGEEGVFSTTLLQTACTVAGASSTEGRDRKKDIIVSFLDNLLMVDSNASLVGLEILSAFVFQFCYGYGSDGDLSLLRVFGPSIEKWVDLPPEVLKKTYELAVYDLPFNLAKFTRREGLSDVVCNRLSRIYTKWLEQGSNETTLAPLRLSLLCCRNVETATNAEDLATLVSSIVSKSN